MTINEGIGNKHKQNKTNKRILKEFIRTFYDIKQNII